MLLYDSTRILKVLPHLHCHSRVCSHCRDITLGLLHSAAHWVFYLKVFDNGYQHCSSNGVRYFVSFIFTLCTLTKHGTIIATSDRFLFSMIIQVLSNLVINGEVGLHYQFPNEPAKYIWLWIPSQFDYYRLKMHNTMKPVPTVFLWVLSNTRSICSKYILH